MTAPADRSSRIFDAAIARPPAERLGFVAKACAGDEALKQEVESLLALDGAAADFLERPAAEAFVKSGAADLVGQTWGSYTIVAALGAGGMGEVYRAHDAKLDRDVALKVLKPEVSADVERRARLAREAQLLAALSHPNIGAIYGLEERDGAIALVLELVEGPTLAERLEHGPLPLREAQSIARQIAEGLQAAHAKGIVHRDLKPANIVVQRSASGMPFAKVLDFGIAKTLAPEGGARNSAGTTMGRLLGTAAYMSPEQARGQAVDKRTDVWAFGCVLYELLTGRPAFQGDTASDIVAAVLTREPDWSALPASTPEPIRLLLRRCLEKSAEERVREIADARLEIEQTLESTSEKRTELTSNGRARETWAASWAWLMLLPVVLLAGLVAWNAWRSPPASEPIPPVSLTTFPGVEWHPSLSPDGNYMAFMWTGPKQDNPDIYVQQVGAGDPVRLTSDGQADHNPVWSPDGRWIAFLRAPRLPPMFSAPPGRNEVRLIHPLGGAERAVGELRIRIVGTPAFLAWCPDSSCLIATDSLGEGQPDALVVLSLESGEKRQLTHPPPSALGDCNPAVSTDGRSLVFRRVPAASAGELHRLALGSGPTGAGAPERLTPGALNAGYPAWMPGSEAILFSAQGRLWRLTMRGAASPTPLPLAGEDGIMPVIARSQPGGQTRLVYVRSFSDRNIWRVDTPAAGAAASSSPVVAIASTRTEIVGGLSPDGRRVAFSSDRSGIHEIWLADPDGANPVRLTTIGGPMSSAPQWSPDGRQIAFQSNRDGQWEIYVTAATGGKPQRMTFDPANDHVPSFSRDGRSIYFSSTRRGSSRTGDYHVWKMPAHGGEAIQVTFDPGFRALEGLDGAYLYFNAQPGQAALWRMPTTGGPAVKLVELTQSSRFAVVEKGVYFLNAPSGQARLLFLDFASGRSTTVAANLGEVREMLTATADGRTILYTRQDSSIDDLMLVDDFR